MEQSQFVDATLRIYRRLREDGPRQRRHGPAVVPLPHAGRPRVAAAARSRTCGSSRARTSSPTSVAYPQKTDVDAAYVRLLERMLTEAGHTAVATHDERADPARDPLRRASTRSRRTGFEFQMLYGVRPQLQLDLVRRGYKVLVATPYGPGVVPVPDAAPRRAPREPALLRQERAPRIAARPRTMPGCRGAEDHRLGDHDRRRARRSCSSSRPRSRSPTGSRPRRWSRRCTARSPAPGARRRYSDRVIVNRLAYRFGDPKRGQIVVFNAPRCGRARVARAGRSSSG